MIIEDDAKTSFVYLSSTEVYIASIDFTALKVKNIMITQIFGTLITTLGVSITPSQHYFLLNHYTLQTNILDAQLITGNQ